jgi:nitrogenase-associated protein
MAVVVFYEHPDSLDHKRQKALLIASGHDVDARDILAEPWSPSSLRAYFGERSVRDWFDPEAERVKSGAINLDKITPQAALVEMQLDPTLIRAPLLRIAGRCDSGFDAEKLHGWIGLTPTAAPVALDSGAEPPLAAASLSDDPAVEIGK